MVLPTDPTALLPSSLDESDWVSLTTPTTSETVIAELDDETQLALRTNSPVAHLCAQAWLASQQSVIE